MIDRCNAALEFSHQNSSLFLEKLVQLLKIPSVSTAPEHVKDMARAAQWLVDELISLGFTKAQSFPTQKHPVVFGEYCPFGDQKPTVLIYGHYDVQPAEPLELWNSGAFAPEVRGENLYARGASDMKGQVVASLSAIRSILAAGEIPVNIKFIIEGEEEIGSPSLTRFLEEHTSLLKSDFALNPDGGMIAADVPTIIYALRGLAYFELRVFGPAHDLHSGMFGGAVHNPAIVLSELIAGMHDENGKVTLPGFYDRVRELSEEESAALAKLPMDDAYYQKMTGANVLYGEKGYTAIERVGARPTLDVNGLLAGFTGQGSKTVIPFWAMAKISMRLVPDQDAGEVHQQLIQYLTTRAPATVRWELESMAGGPACITDIHQPGTRALHKALAQVWQKEPLYKREGGSVPVAVDMQKILGIDSVLTGFGLPDDNLHAPNEKLHLPTWYKGIDALIHFLYNLSEEK